MPPTGDEAVPPQPGADVSADGAIHAPGTMRLSRRTGWVAIVALTVLIVAGGLAIFRELRTALALHDVARVAGVQPTAADADAGAGSPGTPPASPPPETSAPAALATDPAPALPAAAAGVVGTAAILAAGQGGTAPRQEIPSAADSPSQAAPADTNSPSPASGEPVREARQEDMAPKDAPGQNAARVGSETRVMQAAEGRKASSVSAKRVGAKAERRKGASRALKKERRDPGAATTFKRCPPLGTKGAVMCRWHVCNGGAGKERVCRPYLERKP